MRSNTSSTTSSGRAPGRSILLMTTMRIPSSSACLSTKRVCGIGPSNASTIRSAPSAMLSTRSTSPPKSACPGVSMTLIFTSLYVIEMFLDNIVMPRSRSWSLLSSTRSSTCWFSRKTPAVYSRRSTSVVLPWSTCAMMATLRMFSCLMSPRSSRLVVWSSLHHCRFPTQA